MTDKTQLQTLINEISTCLNEYDRLVFDEQFPHELAAPATAEQITQLEHQLGLRLPPSYKAFLELHNGWSDLAGGSKLFACEDHNSQWVKNRIEEWRDVYEGDEFPFSQGIIPLVLGKDESSFLGIDPKAVQENGEMDLVLFDYLKEQSRFKNLVEYLQYRLEILQILIARETQGQADD